MVMKKLPVMAAVALLALVPAGALAGAAKPTKPSPRAHVYRATLRAVGADAAYTHKWFGKAQLVDGKKRNKVTAHVRGLTPGGQYLWHVHQAKAGTHAAGGNPCTQPAQFGNATPYAAFDAAYARKLPVTANAAGNFDQTFRSRNFPLSIAAGDSGEVYYVNVHLTDGTVIACGVLKGSRKATPKYKKNHARRRGGGH